MDSSSVVVDHQTLSAFARRALEEVGLSEENANIVTDSLIQADLRGVDTHGITRLPIYVERIKAGSSTQVRSLGWRIGLGLLWC